MPTFAHVRVLQRLTGLLYFPVTPLFPQLGLLGAAYLPAKFKLRFLAPVPTDRLGAGAWEDQGLVQDVAEEIRARIQDAVVDMLGAPALGVARMSRVLITGLSTYWGGRLAQALERDPEVEVIVGVSPADPTCELTRTEYVRVGAQHALLQRIVHAAAIDTVVDTRLIVDSVHASERAAHENNVIGTMNILAACGGAGSPVRKVVFKSSAHYYGCERDDPAYFTEEMPRPHPPRTPIERDIVEAERAVHAFAEREPGVDRERPALPERARPGHPHQPHALLSLPAVPCILGFDPRYQFIHEDDIAGVLEHAARHDLRGIYNAAGDGVLVLSEVASLLGKPLAPILPPWGTGARRCRGAPRVGLRIPPEMLQQLRFGRALDNRRLKAAGYRFRATSRETVAGLRRAPARARAAPGGGRGLPVRARGRGVPALEPGRARGRQARPRAPHARAARRALARARGAARDRLAGRDADPATLGRTGSRVAAVPAGRTFSYHFAPPDARSTPDRFGRPRRRCCSQAPERSTPTTRPRRRARQGREASAASTSAGSRPSRRARSCAAPCSSR